MAAEKTIRWLALLDLLPRQGQPYTIERIQRCLAEFEMVKPCGERTLRRDLDELADSGLVDIECLEDPETGEPAWRLQRGFHGRARLTPLAAATMKLALEHMRGLLPPLAWAELQRINQQAEKVLRFASAEGPAVRPWHGKLRVLPSGHPLGVPHIPDEVVREVYRALASDLQFEGGYRRPAQPPSERRYHPLALIARPPKFQLVVHSGRDPYVLNLHRLRWARCLDERISEPLGWDLDAWLREKKIDTRVGGRERLVLHTTPELADHWTEMPLGEAQTVTEIAGQRCTPEFTRRLEATVIVTDALRRYLLGLSDQLRVLEPATLADWLHGVAGAMLARDLPQDPGAAAATQRASRSAPNPSGQR